ncbi:MAG: hypothetical protein RBS55_01665 [Bacteroidales bacterium]|jgi:hypothetical protein|nr:hypothetical protein [Bacteroidales bacterium]
MTDTELKWRFRHAKLIGHGMYLNEKLQKAILTQELVDSRKFPDAVRFSCVECRQVGILSILNTSAGWRTCQRWKEFPIRYWLRKNFISNPARQMIK